MNIKLSCAASKGKAAFVLEKAGKVVEKEVFPVSKDSSATLKEYIFEAIIKGLKYARTEVTHEDLLLIEVPNTHLAEWLNGSKEYKGYEVYLDSISDIIETIDCRYLFSKTNVLKAKKALEESPKKVKLEGLSVFDEMM